MKDPRHTPVYLQLATKLRAAGMQCTWFNGPPQCIWGRFTGGIAANDPTKDTA